MKRLLFLCLLLPSICLAAEDDWQKGTVLSYEQKTFTVGQNNTPNTTYTVEIDDGRGTVYVGARTLRFAWQKFPVVTEGGPVTWRIHKDDIMFKDDRGKEFAVTIVKKKRLPPK